MILICDKCNHEFKVHGGHYWRYPKRMNKCPECGSRAHPDELGEEEIRSRNEYVNKGKHGRQIY